MPDRHALLIELLNRAVDQRSVFGTAFSVGWHDQTYSAAAGDLALHQPFFIASVTKLFVTALVLQLQGENRLALDDPITRWLDANTLDGLHRLRGQDHSTAITVTHLLAHTSGLPDYFSDSVPGSQSWQKDLMRTRTDRAWRFEDALAHSKHLQPRFVPGTRGRAHYSDTNFQLLGRIIECIEEQPLATSIARRITQPLELTNTWLYTDPQDQRPHPIHLGRKPLAIPQAMASFQADGGMVSTAPELLRFVRAFFSGHWFAPSVLAGLQVWRRIFYPFESGIGMQRFRLPWWLDPLGRTPELIGYIGLSGTVAFHVPALNISVAGTINQAADPGKALRLTLRLLQAFSR
ncbi:alkaline D-peptidase [Lysobacteraceae bacterium NML120232]|nr:alkaline D-peptidase [Xanthomonadaceae bacterium NML120232]